MISHVTQSSITDAHWEYVEAVVIALQNSLTSAQTKLAKLKQAKAKEEADELDDESIN